MSGLTTASNQYFPTLPQLPQNDTTRSSTNPIFKQGPGDLTTGGLDFGSGTGTLFSSTSAPFGQTQPGVVPQQGQNFTSNFNKFTGVSNAGNGFFTENPRYGNLGWSLNNLLQSQLGMGVTPFNLSALLPTGGQTQSGQLSAPMNSLLQQLFTGYGGGQSNVPGMGTLSNIANNGISALPEWQAMLDAQQRNIQEGGANLREQFAGLGNLAGSPFGTAMSDYQTNVTSQQNALLGQLQQQNILQGQIPVAQSLAGGAMQLGQLGQGLDENAISQLYNEFIRTSPQYNPLLNMTYGLSTSYDPLVSKSYGLGASGAALGNIGSLLGMGSAGLAGGLGATAGGAGLFGSILAGLSAL